MIETIAARRWVIVAILLVAAAPHAYRLVLDRGTCFDLDEGKQMVAAGFLASSGDYVMRQATADLSAPPTLVPLTKWPPTYSLLLAAQVKAGIPAPWAGLFLRMLFLVGAVWGWFLVGRSVVKSELLAALLVIPITFRISMNPTDLFCCAVLPFLLLTLVRILHRERGARWAREALVVSVLVAAMVAMKYSALYFVPGVFVVLIIDGVKRRRLADSLLLPALIVLLPVVVLLATWTGTQADRDVPDQAPEIQLSDVTTRNLHRVVTMPFTTFFLEPFKLNSVVRRIYPSLALNTPLSWLAWKRLINALLVVAMILLLAYYVRHHETDGKVKSMVVIVAVLAACAGAFLVSVDFALNTVGHARTYRYYTPLTPVLILICFQLVRRLTRQPGFALRAAGFAVVLIFLPVLAFMAREYQIIATSPDLRAHGGMSFVAETAARIRGERPAAYFGHIGTYCQSSLPVTNLDTSGQYWDRAEATEPVWVFILGNSRARIGYSDEIDAYVREFDLQTEERDGWEIHYRLVEPGKVRESSGD